MKAILIFIVYVLIGIMAIVGFAWIILKTVMTGGLEWALRRLGLQ